MSNIEKFSEVVASKISRKLSLDDQDKEEVLAYGAFVFIQTALSIIMVALFGIIFNVLMEALLISISASILRKSSGGAHATSPMSCALISVIIFGGFALIVKHYILSISMIYSIVGMIIAFILTYYIMIRLSPVETSTKPIRNPNKRIRLKRLSIITVHILIIMSFILTIIYLQTEQIPLLSIAVCISLGTAWQSISMVSLGHKIIDGIDKVLRGTNKLIRRKNK